MQHEAERIKDISKDWGTEEIPVLVDLEVQHWMAEALEGATRTSELVEGRITQIGVQCTSQDGKRSQNESSDPSPAAKRARQAVLDAATSDPLSDSQLERVVRLALGKRVPIAVKASKAVVACAAAAKAGGDDAPRTPGAASKFAHVRQPKRRLEPEDESENLAPEPKPTGAGESPPAAGKAQSAPPERQQAAAHSAQASIAAPTTPPESTAASGGATAKTKKKKAKTKATEVSTGTATEAWSKEAPPIAKTGDKMPLAADPPRRKRTHCPVFG